MTEKLPKPLADFAVRVYEDSWYGAGFSQPPGELLKLDTAMIHVHNIGARATVDATKRTTTAAIEMIKKMKISKEQLQEDHVHNEVCDWIIQQLRDYEHLL